jgi:TPR repeat protein
MYLLGEGTGQNDEEALKWYTVAAQRDYAPAQCSLGYFYAHKQHNFHAAIEWYRKAAVQGYITALWRLGTIYKKGTGVPVNREQAYEYFELAADRGHIFSQREIAVAFLKGQCGWSNILKGFGLLAKCLIAGAKLTLKSKNDERLRN